MQIRSHALTKAVLPAKMRMIMTAFSADSVKATLTDDHKIRRLEGHHALIHQTHAGVRECRDRLKQREPPNADVPRLFLKDVVVPSARRDIWGHDDETGELNKDKILSL
jgi:hypothetical protein